MPSSPASEHREEPAGAPEPGPDDGGLGELQARYGELDDRYRRALADLDNFRKRSVQLTDSRVAEARERLTRDWLEAVDSVERALSLGTDGPEAEGLRAVRDQMRAILGRQGVAATGAVGERFDPERHEAIAVRDADEADDNGVVEVSRSGYLLGDRVLRPAQVVVGRRAAGGH
jgi:molecular chaperone GrpE